MYMYGDEKSLIPTWYRELWIRGRRVMLPIHICNSAIKCSRTLSTGGCINSTWFWIRISCRRICNKAIKKAKLRKTKIIFNRWSTFILIFENYVTHSWKSQYILHFKIGSSLSEVESICIERRDATATCKMTKIWLTCKTFWWVHM